MPVNEIAWVLLLCIGVECRTETFGEARRIRRSVLRVGMISKAHGHSGMVREDWLNMVS